MFYIGAYIKVANSGLTATTTPGAASNPSAGGYVAIVLVYLYVTFYGLGWSGTCWTLVRDVELTSRAGSFADQSCSRRLNDS